MRTLPDWAVPALKWSHSSRFSLCRYLRLWLSDLPLLSLIFIHSSIPLLRIPPRSNQLYSVTGHGACCMKNATTPQYSPTPRKVWTLDGSGWIWLDLVGSGSTLLHRFFFFESLILLQYLLTHLKTKLGLSVIHADDRDAIKSYDDERYQYKIVL